MFVSKAKYDALKEQVVDLRYDVNNLLDANKRQRAEYELLLAHFGLHEHYIPPATEIRKKGGPEQG